MEVVHAATDPKLVAFGSAMPDLGLDAPRAVRRMMTSATRAHGARALAYEVPPGHRELRVQIARRGVDAGCAFGPDDVVITSGCQEAMVLCLRAICEPGRHHRRRVTDLLRDPAGHPIARPSRPRDPDPPGDGDQPGVAGDGDRAVLDRRPGPDAPGSNPLGYVMPDDRKVALLRLLEAHDVPLIEDDINGELVYAAGRPRAHQVVGHPRAGAPLLVGVEVDRARPARRLGGAGSVGRPSQLPEARQQHGERDASPDRGGRVPGARRVRSPPARRPSRLPSARDRLSISSASTSPATRA